MRQELVRVSVRAVDIFFGCPAGRPRPRRRASQGDPVCAQVLRRAEELRAGLPAGFGWIGTHSSRVVACSRRASVASAREGRFATETRSGLLASSIRSRLRLRSFPLQTVAADLSLSDDCPATRKPDQLQRRVSHSALQCLRRSRGTTAHNKCSDNDDATQRKRL